MHQFRKYVQAAVAIWVCLMLLGTARTVSAAGIYISQIEGTYEPGKMTPGGTLKIHLAVNNDLTDPPPQDGIRGMTLGFELAQTGGVTWSNLSLDWAPDFSPGNYSFGLASLPIYDADSTPPDTCAIELAVLFSGSGLPSGFNQEIAILTVENIQGPLGGTITIDSVATYGPAALAWAINSWDGGLIADDEFVGATIELDECCVGTTGNVTGGEDVVSLTDFSILRNHLFITFEELPCWKEANVDASPDGVINLTDITKLVNHLFVTFEPLPACP